MKLYAEIDERGKCFHITNTEIPLSERILLVEENVFGMVWDGEKWNEPEPIPEQPLSEQEQIAIDTALNVEYMACLLEASLT